MRLFCVVLTWGTVVRCYCVWTLVEQQHRGGLAVESVSRVGQKPWNSNRFSKILNFPINNHKFWKYTTGMLVILRGQLSQQQKKNHHFIFHVWWILWSENKMTGVPKFQSNSRATSTVDVSCDLLYCFVLNVPSMAQDFFSLSRRILVRRSFDSVLAGKLAGPFPVWNSKVVVHNKYKNGVLVYFCPVIVVFS